MVVLTALLVREEVRCDILIRWVDHGVQEQDQDRDQEVKVTVVRRFRTEALRPCPLDRHGSVNMRTIDNRNRKDRQRARLTLPP